MCKCGSKNVKLVIVIKMTGECGVVRQYSNYMTCMRCWLNLRDVEILGFIFKHKWASIAMSLHPHLWWGQDKRICMAE